MVLKKVGYGLALIAAAAFGYWIHPNGDQVQRPVPEETGKRSATLLPDVSDGTQVSALRRKVHELESRLADSRTNELSAVSNALVRAAAERIGRPPPPGSFGRERLEELRKSDPARFAQVTNRLAKMFRERKNRQAARVSFLASVSTSGMSAQEKDTHDEYQELLAKREALEEQIHQPDISEDSRHELMNEMRELDHQMRTLGESERKVLLNGVAQAIGMQGDAAAELVETVSDVFEATEAGGGPPGPPPGGDAPPPGE